MADITQTLGIDASQAIDALKQLDNQYAKFEARIQSVGQTILGYNKIVGTASKVSFAPALQSSAQAAQAATQKIQKLSVTWETLARVVATQLIVRTMTQIREAISEATSEAVKFQKQVALISTIADGAGFDQIAGAVRSISDNFNLPLLETAAGVYQALSNQVGDFGESLRFTEEAAKFAKATNSSLADSVDLLSGALRSYGLEVEDTGKVSGIFFTAIDKGRITADQLSNSIGRVLEPASEIGIELEELSGALATISDKGLGTAETLTQFRGIVTSLTKPTDAMKEKLRELGFESSRQAILTRGLDGILDDLAKSTDGTAESFAKLFPNVRAIGGSLALTGENLETFSENIRLAKENGAEFANSKFLQAIDTDAEKLTKALNQVSNAFTVEFGQALVKSGADLIDAAGGVENITDSIKAMADAITTVTSTAADLERLTGIFSTLIKFNPLTGITAIKNDNIKAVLADSTKLREEHEATAKALAKSEQERLDKVAEGYKDLTKVARTQLQAVSAEFIRNVDDAKRGDDRLVDNAKSTLGKIVDLRGDFLKAIEKGIQDSQSAIEQSQDRIFDLQQGLKDRKFEASTRGFNDAAKVAALTLRSSDLAREAEQTLRDAFRTGNENLKQRALNQFERADAAAKEAENLGKSAGSRALEARAAKQVEDVARRQLAVEEEINRQQAIRQQALVKEREKQEALLKALREQQQIAVENTGQFDKSGREFDPAEQAKRAARQQEALKKIAKLALGGADVKAADFLGLGNFLKSIETSVARDPIKLIFDVDSSVEATRAKIQQAFNNIDLKLPFLKDLEAAVGRPLRSSTQEIDKALDEVNAQVLALERRKAEQFKLDQQIVNNRFQAEKLIAQLEQSQSQKSVLDRFTIPSKEIDKAIAKLKELVTSGNLTEQQIQELENKLHNVNFGTDTGPLAGDVALLKSALDTLRNLSQSQQGAAKIAPVDDAQLQRLKAVLDSFQVTNPQVKAQQTATALLSATTPAQSVATAALNTASAYERAATAINTIANAKLPALPQSTTAHFGRHLSYMANGGFTPRGLDTIPVMARAGETIINPDSSRKFFSQIQAINAGKRPVFRSEGGGVTNIGDISVNVHGGGTSEETARSIAVKLRREIRRGSTRL
jgi:TP901 family phage tail tape measure protein